MPVARLCRPAVQRAWRPPKTAAPAAYRLLHTEGAAAPDAAARRRLHLLPPAAALDLLPPHNPPAPGPSCSPR
eukprot:7748-Chlamydomonas_euryale.AAC.1